MPSENPDDNPMTELGVRLGWGGEQPFGIYRADRRQHIYVIGKTGSGKTTLLRNLILQDIAVGNGVGLIDPHGDFADDLLDFVPSWRTDDVVYFNPADLDYPVGLNLLRTVSPQRRYLLASGLVSALKSVWRENFGPRMEYILYNAAAALLDVENSSLLGLQRMLSDARYRAWVVKQVQDPVIRSFWLDEFEQYDPRFMREAVSPIQNKVGQLLAAPPIRNILGQVRSKIDARFMMDRSRIFIANLSKGKIGEDKANLLGSILVSQFQLAAMERAAIAEEDRRDFSLVIDEFHNFATDTFASILSEARKYRLGLVLGHQYSAQLREEIRDAVFGNAGTLISFRVGEADAELLAREFGHTYLPQTFTDLANFNVCVKLMSYGEQRDPFLGRTLAPTAVRYGRRENIIRRSREKYATPRAVVEDKIRRWMRR